MKLIYLYLRNIFIGIVQLISIIFFGATDECLSSRLGKTQRGDYGVALVIIASPLRVLVDYLFYFRDGKHHCLQHIEDNKGDSAIFANLKDD